MNKDTRPPMTEVQLDRLEQRMYGNAFNKPVHEHIEGKELDIAMEKMIDEETHIKWCIRQCLKLRH